MRTQIDRQGVEVAIYTVENAFETGELTEKIRFGYERSARRGLTFLAVIDAAQTMRLSSVNVIAQFLDQFTDLSRLPRVSPEFRIAIIALAPIGIGAPAEALASHPVASHPWIQIRSSLAEGIAWCRRNTVWQTG